MCKMLGGPKSGTGSFPVDVDEAVVQCRNLEVPTVLPGTFQELPLGTDLLKPLGIRVSVDGGRSQIASKERDVLSMKLLEALNIPAHFTQTVKLELETRTCRTLTLIEDVKTGDLMVGSVMVETSKYKAITLALHNWGLAPVTLEVRSVLGEAQSMKVMPRCQRNRGRIDRTLSRMRW